MNEHEIASLVWWAEERVRGFMTGLHKSPDFGYSVEFAQHRAYVPGDSPKHIDWSVLAKTDKYLLKQYEAESNLRTYFVVDSSSSMQSGVDRGLDMGFAAFGLAMAPVGAFGRMACESIGNR